ncbi:hypothetical protein MYCTH_2296565 [Thermothelomyces thermophilus ATCC 42464]|uniref:Uncharacterized protein n=1 Tax=Thermothelomyces thermophilus (strain ATCC 42464 / BCRC 31852 / DSM 1799) TaxID=573729 RepID=G2Q1Z1_THET4|nr:uncharacterized protein MYCTH_2296565 [Thermothelomyces thermophilus ATCC 42464]AEO54223.1 hypothetical protein MYCTH_2296565 [Thermothelomyces thermophilus ATCC 42464]
MERDGNGRAGPDIDAKAAQPNTRFTSPLVIHSASRRRSLFSRPKAHEDNARPGSSGSVSDGNVASPSSTRIPRPAQRRPFTLSDAYRRAEEEEAAQGSPSPAPRLWRSPRESAGKKHTKASSPSVSALPQRGGLREEPSGTSHAEGHEGRPGSSQQSDTSDSTFDDKLRQFARDQRNPEETNRRSSGFLSRSRLGTRIVESGKELLVRKTSRGSFDSFFSPQPGKGTTTSPSLLRRFSGRKRESSDEVLPHEGDDQALADHETRDELLGQSTTPPRARSAAFLDSQTPNRSFAWQADADFTEADLQISNSPPVILGRRNTKIDEIRALEARVSQYFSENPIHESQDTQTASPGASDARPAAETRDEGPALPNQPLESHTVAKDALEDQPDDGNAGPRPRSVSQTNLKVDELRLREIETLSRKALATARLDELRERNIRISRSPSPDVARISSRERTRAFSPLRDRLRKPGNETSGVTIQGEGGQTDKSIFGPPPPVRDRSLDNQVDTGGERSGEDRKGQHSAPEAGEDPGDEVLRRLGAATGSSPTLEVRTVANSNHSAPRSLGLAERARQRRSIGGAKSDVRPTVGFSGLSRSPSADSKTAKRKSFAHSDVDPTERIEGEMKLFAPQENQSEKGSLRAPSPEAEEEAPDETPKPTQTDPSTQPTPKVTGAFVETPATVKVEKVESPVSAPPAENKDVESQRNGARRLSNSSSGDSKSSLSLGERDGVTARRRKRTLSSRGERAPGRSSLLSTRRRARSLSRSRTPLINSARPPTVRDDLLEIQRANHIEDSTLEDLADLLSHQGHSPAVPPSAVSDDDKLDRQKELEAYDRISRSLETGLLGIRSAKQGIERLEDKVSQAELKDHTRHAGHGDRARGESASCLVCQGSKPPVDASVTYLHLPLPYLWSRRPKFRFTLFGLSLFLLSLWYVLESWICFRYCKPEYCYPGTACDWSSDDPVWGYAIPVKLDEWATGGQGRRLVRRLQPEVSDWLADMWDAATGTDITTIDTSRYGWEQKRQYRRRLAKKGLRKPFVERPEDKAVFSGWKSVRQANERAQSAQEMGYEVDEDETIGSDERL